MGFCVCARDFQSRWLISDHCATCQGVAHSCLLISAEFTLYEFHSTSKATYKELENLVMQSASLKIVLAGEGPSYDVTTPEP